MVSRDPSRAGIRKLGVALDVALPGLGHRKCADRAPPMESGRQTLLCPALDRWARELGGGLLGPEATDGTGHVCRASNRPRLGGGDDRHRSALSCRVGTRAQASDANATASGDHRNDVFYQSRDSKRCVLSSSSQFVFIGRRDACLARDRSSDLCPRRGPLLFYPRPEVLSSASIPRSDDRSAFLRSRIDGKKTQRALIFRPRPSGFNSISSDRLTCE